MRSRAPKTDPTITRAAGVRATPPRESRVQRMGRGKGRFTAPDRMSAVARTAKTTGDSRTGTTDGVFSTDTTTGLCTTCRA